MQLIGGTCKSICTSVAIATDLVPRKELPDREHWEVGTWRLLQTHFWTNNESTNSKIQSKWSRWLGMIPLLFEHGLHVPQRADIWPINWQKSSVGIALVQLVQTRTCLFVVCKFAQPMKPGSSCERLAESHRGTSQCWALSFSLAQDHATKTHGGKSLSTFWLRGQSRLSLRWDRCESNMEGQKDKNHQNCSFLRQTGPFRMYCARNGDRLTACLNSFSDEALQYAADELRDDPVFVLPIVERCWWVGASCTEWTSLPKSGSAM